MDSTVQGWAVRMAGQDHRALEALRLLAGVEVAAVGGDLWVRGPAACPERLPVSARFEWLADGLLRTPGARVPCGRLPPEAKWSDLRSRIGVALPARRPAAAAVEKITLRLVRGGEEVAPDALLLPLDAWVRWAVRAPAVRLGPLRFAATASSALVLGRPLPPLPGARLVSRDGVLVPAGWRWEPAVDPAVARRACGLRADELALWPGEGAPVAVIPAEAVVPASRSAARLTREGVS